MSTIDYWYLDDSCWHKQSGQHPERAMCGRSWQKVSRVCGSPAPGGEVCEVCEHSRPAASAPAPTRSQGTPPRRSKALRRKMAELRARAVREDLLEPLASDELAREVNRSRSVTTVSGGLPTLGKRR